MNKLTLITTTLIIVIFLHGCGENKFNSRDPNSLEKMMEKMSYEEKVLFLDDASIAISALGGNHEYELNGYTVLQIREIAKDARDFLQKKNVVFLSETIADMKASGRTTISLTISSIGLISGPIAGYIPKSYSIDTLQEKLSALQSPDAATKYQASGAPRRVAGLGSNN